MTDQTPDPVPASPPRAWIAPFVRTLRDLGPYALGLTVFVITANVTLNTTAAHYADELFTLALVLIRTGGHPPAPPSGQG